MCDTELEEHEHIWGKFELSRFTGNPHRHCQIPGCRAITMDSDEDDDDGCLRQIDRTADGIRRK